MSASIELRYGDYIAVIENGETRIYDCDGNLALKTHRDIRDEPLHTFCEGLALGQKWGENIGRNDAKRDIRNALGI